jgi:hypothetical protein
VLWGKLRGANYIIVYLTPFMSRKKLQKEDFVALLNLVRSSHNPNTPEAAHQSTSLELGKGMSSDVGFVFVYKFCSFCAY